MYYHLGVVPGIALVESISWIQNWKSVRGPLQIDKMSAFYAKHFAQGPEDVASMPSSGCMEDEDSGQSSDSGTQDDSGSAQDSGTSLRR